MRHYQTDDFISPITEPVPVVVDKKISLLYDLCILTMSKTSRDRREANLREILSQYSTEIEVDNAVHDIIFNKSLNTFLAQKGATK